jgi:hypothetical protein
MTKGFKELLAKAKWAEVTSFDELEELVYTCQNEITGADFECVLKKLKIGRYE